MAGVVTSKYSCDIDSWNAFNNRLRELNLNIEQKEDIETGFSIEIKREKGAQGCVFISASLIGDPKDGTIVQVGMLWVIKNAGDDPHSSREIALQVEEILLSIGAKCFQGPVKKVADGRNGKGTIKNPQ